MAKIIENIFYKNRVSLNVLANSLQNAKAVYEAANGYVLVGMLSKDYPDAQTAAMEMEKWGNEINHAISVGLGAGDARQATFVSEIAKLYKAAHFNQVFPAVGGTRASVANDSSWINSLVSPTGKTGYVNLSTGAYSSSISEAAIVPVEAAIALVKDMGGNALKFFPMKGLAFEEEYRAVARACAREGMGLEPTGGIDLDNFEAILQIALEEKVEKIIPHVYSSIVHPETGETNVEDVKELSQIICNLVERHG